MLPDGEYSICSRPSLGIICCTLIELIGLGCVIVLGCAAATVV